MDRKPIAWIGGVRQYTRGQVMEALVDLYGLDTMCTELSLVAYNKGYRHADEALEKARDIANAESYTIK